MKTHLKHLLGLALMVLIFSGCQNPSVPETPDVNEPPVVETPEENARLVKVEFVWGANPQISKINKNRLAYSHLYRYLSDLHKNENGNYVFDFPEGYDEARYYAMYDDIDNVSDEDFKKLCEDAFEEVFGKKYYKEGTTIDLKKWTSGAVDLVESDEDEGFISTAQLYFLAEDIGTNYNDIESLETIEVYNQDIRIYVYWKYNK